MKIRGFKVGFKVVTFKPGKPVDIQAGWADSSAKTLRAAKIDCRKRFKGRSAETILRVGVICEYNLGPWTVSVSGNKPGAAWTDSEGVYTFELI